MHPRIQAQGGEASAELGGPVALKAGARMKVKRSFRPLQARLALQLCSVKRESRFKITQIAPVKPELAHFQNAAHARRGKGSASFHAKRRRALKMRSRPLKLRQRKADSVEFRRESTVRQV